jgi:hypothetical protein
MPTPLPPEARAHAVWLLLLIALIGVLGLVLLALLAIAWRRYNARLRDPQHKTRMPDIWQAGGERLVNEIDQSQAPPPPPDGSPDESADDDSDDDDEDDDDDDDPKPWQKN